jgi:hypothetical protein
LGYPKVIHLHVKFVNFGKLLGLLMDPVVIYVRVVIVLRGDFGGGKRRFEYFNQ